MRVLYIHFGRYHGGAEQSLLLLLRYSSGSDNYVLCSKGGEFEAAALENNVAVYSVPDIISSWNMNIFSYLAYPIQAIYVYYYSLKFRINIIHVNSIYSLLQSIPTSVISNCKLVCHIRDMPRRRWLVKLAGIFCDKLIAVSESVKTSLSFFGAPEGKIECIYNGAAPREKSIVNKNEKVVTFVNIGQFVEWKKQAKFIYAVKMIYNKTPKAEFWLVGDRPERMKYKNKLVNYISKEGLTGIVKILPWSDDMALIWGKADCLIHTAEQEPFGRVIVEAMANEVFIIAVNSGGPGEIIEAGKTGLLFAKDDCEGISSAMLDYYSFPGKYKQFINNAKKAVVQKFSASIVAEKVSCLHEKIIGR